MLALYTDKEGTPEEKLGIYFDMYDVDKNNALDMKEIKKMITAIKSQVMCQTVAHDFIKWDFGIFARVIISFQELFRKFEKDDNGNVSKDEFIKVLSEDPDIVKYLTNA